MNRLIWNGRAWALIGLGVLLNIAEPSYAAEPVANPDTRETPFDMLVNIDVVANDTDIDGDLDRNSVAIETNPASGEVVNHFDGTVTYTPTPGFSGTDTFSYTVKDTQGETSNEARVTITVQPPDNMEPNADAEPESQTALVGTQVNLDGSASNDPDSGPIALTFQWSFTDKPGTSGLTDANISVSGLNGELASFTPDVIGTYKVTLTVFDGGLSDQDEVVIDVQNTEPNADAEPESQTALVGTQVNLDGSASNDPDSGPIALTFQWSLTDKPGTSGLTDANISVSGLNGELASFTPDVIGTYKVTLTVFDGGLSDQDEVVIDVQNTEPNADAEPESQTALVGTQVNLDGSASNDPDSGPIALTFQWSLTDKPGTSGLTDANISVSGLNGELASFTPDVIGTYKVTLTVFDGGLSDQDEVVIDVQNTPPNADAEPESQTAVALTLVTLNGSGSDPDRGPDPLTFRWGFAQVPPSGSALTDANISVSGPNREVASFTPDVAGLYRLRLTVSDGDLSDSDDVDITVTPAPADLDLSLTNTPDLLTVNGQLTYTITVTNKGPGTATGVQVVDSLPPEAVLEGLTDSSQGECSSDTVTVVCDLGTLAADAEATVTINVIPKSIGELSNAAHVTALEPDPGPAPNSDTATTIVKEPEPDAADLAVTAEATPAPGTDGKLTYTLTVTNNGQAIATGVQLTNDLPADVVREAITWSQGTCHTDADPVLCDLGMLPSGETATVRIDVIRPEGTTLPNRAAINGDQLDPDPLNNFALTSALDLPKRQTTCDSKRCKLKLTCNKSGFLGGMCKNRIKLFVGTRARRTTRALQLSDARVARGRVPFATVSSNFLGGNTNKVRLKLTRKGREIASMFVQQGRKRFRGEMRIISNGAGGQDIMRLWVRLK